MLAGGLKPNSHNPLEVGQGMKTCWFSAGKSGIRYSYCRGSRYLVFRDSVLGAGMQTHRAGFFTGEGLAFVSAMPGSSVKPASLEMWLLSLGV